jgi:uncharacterized membrane protein YkgB
VLSAESAHIGDEGGTAARRRGPALAPASAFAHGVQALAVAGFAVIEFALVIIPLAFLAAAPARTMTATQHSKNWLTGHVREILAALALFADGYMVISATLRPLS